MEDLGKRLFNREFLDNWFSNYHKMAAFCKQNNVGAAGQDEELTRWIAVQRSIRHLLPEELKAKLATLSFDFDDKGRSWEAMHGQLVCIVQKNGHAFLPDDLKHEELKDWLIRQILNKKLLSKSQFQSLDSLGVDWDRALSRDHRWELMFMRLKEFYTAFGHCRVPLGWAKDRQLGLWVTVQRRGQAKGRLREDRQRMLQEIGFIWDMKSQYDAQWEQYFQELMSFRKTHGHCRVPGKHQKLVSWIERQRIAKTKRLLSADREERLHKLGFIWSFEKIKRESWEERYRQLCAYRQMHGHSFVPVNWSGNKTLGVWVASQRWLEAKDKLGADRKRRLNELGFVWSRDTQKQLKSVYDTQWEASFGKLRDYRQAHGTCQVSVKTDPVLQRWTRWQRKLFYQGKLSPERTGRLNEIHFPWSVQEGYWMRMYDALLTFKKRFGHTHVSSQWEPNPRLAAWAYRMRRGKQGLTVQKVELLNKVGFDWAHSPKTAVPWREMYGRLVKFKHDHGHTRVPLRWQEDSKLGKWVSRMRGERERLAPERAALLEAIGFDWGYRLSSRKSANDGTSRVCRVGSCEAGSSMEQE